MRTADGSGPMCRLRVTSPESLRGSVLEVGASRCVIGRSPTSRLRLDHPDVSRTHAAIEHRAGRTIIEDLGSTNGTTVNGTPIDRPRELQHGDLIGFGPVATVFEEQGPRSAPTGAMGRVPVGGSAGEECDPAPPADAGARFDVDQQHGSWISNVGGDQYVMAERQSFLREIAAARTRARRVITVGFLLFVAGLFGQLWVMYEYSLDFQRAWSSFPEDPAATGQPELPELALGVAVVCVALLWLGVIVMIIGLVLHVVATARRRRVADEAQLFGPARPTPVPPTRSRHRGGPDGLQHR